MNRKKIRASVSIVIITIIIVILGITSYASRYANVGETDELAKYANSNDWWTFEPYELLNRKLQGRRLYKATRILFAP